MPCVFLIVEWFWNTFVYITNTNHRNRKSNLFFHFTHNVTGVFSRQFSKIITCFTLTRETSHLPRFYQRSLPIWTYLLKMALFIQTFNINTNLWIKHNSLFNTNAIDFWIYSSKVCRLCHKDTFFNVYLFAGPAPFWIIVVLRLTFKISNLPMINFTRKMFWMGLFMAFTSPLY